MSELVSVAMQPKISGNGKRLWSKEQRTFVVGEAAKPGMSVSQVSRRYNINANQIFYWIRLARMANRKPAQGIVPIGVIGVPAAPMAPAKPIEIELNNGTKVRISDGAQMPLLQSVLQMLGGFT